MTDARILHARSGALLEQLSGIEGEAYEVSSLRLAEPRSFNSLDEAERAFEAEVTASEKDPALMAMLGGA